MARNRSLLVRFGLARVGRLTLAGALALAVAGPALAFDVPDASGLRGKAFRNSALDIETSYKLPAELSGDAASRAANDLSALGVASDRGRIDVRSGRWATITPSQPLIPGSGVGNRLTWQSLGEAAPATDSALEGAASDALVSYLSRNAKALRLDLAQTAASPRVTVHEHGSIIHVYLPRVVNGVPVRGEYLSAVINHGNLTLLGLAQWGDVDVATTPSVTGDAALTTARDHARPFASATTWGKTELTLVATSKDQAAGEVGQGYGYRLVWVVRPRFAGNDGRFEALVDALSGELLSFEDTNDYATAREVKGGVYPVTNDGVAPDGVEQSGWGMPYATVTTTGGNVTSDAGGNIAPVDGNISASLTGQYVKMSDGCGASSLSSATNLDFGASTGTDCTTPGVGGAGNTHASRSGFYELNRIKHMASSYLPSNSWLQGQLTSNMNINNTCNAFWNGTTVNFYRSGGGCANTGEIAAVFDHEWGHGLDDNDANPSIVGVTQEGVADLYAAFRLNTSCIGRNFTASNCSGFGDACTACTGVRDIDYAKHVSGQPHTYTWANSNCSGAVHCTGHPYSESVWDLWKRDLKSAPYNLDEQTAHTVATRLLFIGGGNMGAGYSGGAPNGGCAATSGYQQYLAADDDNGNLNDGTPHMAAIYAAFNRHQIACGTPTVATSGCSGTPVAAPSLNASGGDTVADLSWSSIAGASSYEIYRTDGVFACEFGKIKVASTAGTSFHDTGLQNGEPYSYIVLPKGSAASCFGTASNCATTTPAAGPELEYLSSTVNDSAGDNDGVVEPGESIQTAVTLASNSQPSTGVSATLSTATPGITITDNAASFPNVPANSQATSLAPHFSYSVDSGVACGTTIDFGLSIATSQGSHSDTFTQVVGAPVSGSENTYASTDTPIAIPDNPAAGITSTRTVPNIGNVSNVRVAVDITHTYRGDLQVKLESPNGTVVTLANNTGGSADNIVATYPDTATPDGPGVLADFVGDATAGNWKLTVQDTVSVDTGTLNSWTLYLTGQSYVCSGTPVCSDGDGDGYGNPASGVCTFPQLDCNDGNAAVNPGATENCSNGIDDDCDGFADSADPSCASACADGDGDGYGNPGNAACPNGSATDCDDTNAAVNPGATEVPRDGVDNDCNPNTPPQTGCNPTPESAEAAVAGDGQRGQELPIDLGLWLIPASLLVFGLRARRRA